MNRVMYRVMYDSILGITEISQYPQHLQSFKNDWNPGDFIILLYSTSIHSSSFSLVIPMIMTRKPPKIAPKYPETETFCQPVLLNLYIVPLDGAGLGCQSALVRAHSDFLVLSFWRQSVSLLGGLQRDHALLFSIVLVPMLGRSGP
jgi:hypothetical protein